MIFIWLSPVFIAVNIYYIYEICKWLSAIEKAVCVRKNLEPVRILIRFVKIMYGILWSIASLAIYVAFLIPSVSKSENSTFFVLKRVLKLIGNYHLGVFIYMGMALMVVLVCRLFEIIFLKIKGKRVTKDRLAFNLRRSVLGFVYVSFIVAITLYGAHKASDIKDHRYEISLDKSFGEVRDLKMVMVADLHLGYNIGVYQMEKMVRLINEEDPDLVVIAGDIFDNEYEALDDPERLIELLSSIKSKYGVYAVYGNHDVSEKIIGGFTFNWKEPGKGSAKEMDEFLEKAGITLLTDEAVCINDSFYLYGRPDYERPGKNVTVRKTPMELVEGLDTTKPIIVIDHEPRELKELSEAGVDIDLCGHTHDGQFFPMNLTSRYFTWENSAGLLIKGDMFNIVTSGVGLFGPNIRIGTQAEICTILAHGDSP